MQYTIGLFAERAFSSERIKSRLRSRLCMVLQVKNRVSKIGELVHWNGDPAAHREAEDQGRSCLKGHRRALQHRLQSGFLPIKAIMTFDLLSQGHGGKINLRGLKGLF